VIEPIAKFTDQLRVDAPELFRSSSSTTTLSPTSISAATITTTNKSTSQSTPSNHSSPTTRPSPTTASTLNVGLEEWHPSPTPTYDLIWNQWCLGHLTDRQLVAYLRRLIPILKPQGWIVVKENVLGDGMRSAHSRPDVVGSARGLSRGGAGDDNRQEGNGDGEEEEDWTGEADLYDEEDSSVTRTAGKFEWIFGRAGLRVVRTEMQRGFGRELGLFPVRMWGLRPAGVGLGGEQEERE
jgi:hypothetical protein